MNAAMENRQYVPGQYRPGKYVREAKEFFRKCIGEEIYGRIMAGTAGRCRHYVAARACLQQDDWEKFVWIEQFGSLEGYPGNGAPPTAAEEDHS